MNVYLHLQHVQSQMDNQPKQQNQTHFSFHTCFELLVSPQDYAIYAANCQISYVFR